MTNYVVLKLEGEDGLKLVDFSAGTVSSIDESAASSFGFMPHASKGSAAMVKGIDIAVAVRTRDNAFAGQFYNI
jgi:hypothetical protein